MIREPKVITGNFYAYRLMMTAIRGRLKRTVRDEKKRQQDPNRNKEMVKAQVMAASEK